MFLCVKRVNTTQLRSVKNKYCKEKIEAKVGIYMCPLKMKIISVGFYRLIIDKTLNVKSDCCKTIKYL